MSSYGPGLFQPPGFEFQEDLTAALRKNMQNPSRVKTPYKHATPQDKRIDEHEGTDIIWNGIRLDTTLAFMTDKKQDYMPAIYHTNIDLTPIHKLDIGVRIGVAYYDRQQHKTVYSNYPEPVIVVGTTMEAEEYERLYSDLMPDFLDKNINEISLAITDAYLDYTTEDEEERNYIEKPLKINKNYNNSYRNQLMQKYKELNDIQMHEKTDPELLNC